MKRKITRTKKDADGAIQAICNPDEWWSPVKKETAISEIKAAGKPYSLYSPYYTEYKGHRSSIIVIEDRNKGDYLRTDPDNTKNNNLEYLLDC